MSDSNSGNHLKKKKEHAWRINHAQIGTGTYIYIYALKKLTYKAKAFSGSGYLEKSRQTS